MSWRAPGVPTRADPARRAILRAWIADDNGPRLRDLSAEWRDEIDAYDDEGRTPLYEAVEAGRVEATRALVALGADAGRRLNTGWADRHRALTPWQAALTTSCPAVLVACLLRSDTTFGLDLAPARVEAALAAWADRRAPATTGDAGRDAGGDHAWGRRLLGDVQARMRQRLGYRYDTASPWREVNACLGGTNAQLDLFAADSDPEKDASPR